MSKMDIRNSEIQCKYNIRLKKVPNLNLMMFSTSSKFRSKMCNSCFNYIFQKI